MDGGFCGERCQERWHGQFDTTTERPVTVRLASWTDPATIERLRIQVAELAAVRDRLAGPEPQFEELPSALDGDTEERASRAVAVTWDDPAVPSRRLRRGALANIPPAMLAVAASFHPGARVAAEAERLNARLRAAFPDHADEAIAAARHRAHTSFDTYEQAVAAVIADPDFASANAKNPQVASHPDLARGWLSRWFDRLFGRTT